MNDSHLLEHVANAFGPPVRPEQFTDRNHCCECAEHDDLLRSRDPDSLSEDDVGNPGWDPICFVTNEAFTYYFPALARLALAEPNRRRGWYLEQLLFHLTHDGCKNRRLLAATIDQKKAVTAFLRHVATTRSATVTELGCEAGLSEALALWGGEAAV